MFIDTFGESKFEVLMEFYHGFSFIFRYPQSFRATLAQVSSDMYNTLMAAHTAMDKIQLSIRQVPSQMKTALKIVTSGSDNMLKSMLPRTLTTISRLATESADAANATLRRFDLLQDLLGEIIELSASTQSSNEADIDRMNEQKRNATLEQDRLEQQLQQIKQQFAESKRQLEEARRRFVQAMNDAEQVIVPELIPTRGFNDEQKKIVGEAINFVFNPIKTIGCWLRKCKTPTYKVDNTKFENAMKLAQLAKEELEQAEKLHNEYFHLLLNEQNELAKIMNQMGFLDFSKLTTEEIVKLLLEATQQIYLIREQWARLIQFFSKLSVQAENTQKVSEKMSLSSFD